MKKSMTTNQAMKAAAQRFRNKSAPGKGQAQERVNTGQVARAFAAPAAVGYQTASKFSVERSGRYKDGIVIRGSDHLEYVVVPAGEVAGSVCNEIYINPSDLGGTRLSKYAGLYEKYIFEELSFEYVPSVGSTTPGALVLAYDRDISDPTPPVSEQGVRQYTAYEGSVDGNVWTLMECRNRLQAPDSGYYTNPVAGGDDRLSYQGQFYVATVVPTALEAGSTLGRIRLHYKCHFFVPQLENTFLTAQITSSTPLPTATTSGADYIATLAKAVDGVVTGYQKWQPVLDSLGKYFIPLDPGTYKMTSNINGVTGNPVASTGGNYEILTPTLVPNENLPASAPQSYVTEEVNNGATMASGDTLIGLVDQVILGVARGGAKLYQDYTIPTQTGGSPRLAPTMFLERLAGYTAAADSPFELAAKVRRAATAKVAEKRHDPSGDRVSGPPVLQTKELVERKR